MLHYSTSIASLDHAHSIMILVDLLKCFRVQNSSFSSSLLSGINIFVHTEHLIPLHALESTSWHSCTE